MLVAIDGSETSMRAAEYAINLSKIQNQQLRQEESEPELVGLAVIGNPNFIQCIRRLTGIRTYS
ncbi:MAG TPA: universal stress protein [Nitrososphaeraceae archaeon]|nr:universal stress protein [Nitrososphaeraceae archaeon]